MENLNIPYNKYHNGKIYKITDVAYTECYIGSTVQPLCNRMAEHRKHYHRYKSGKKSVYVTSFQLFDKYGYENCKIELIEYYVCANRDELQRREGYWIRQEEVCINKQIAGRSPKEYRVDNIDRIKKQHKLYYDTNKDRILTMNSAYKKLDKYKEQQKGYREATKQEKQEYDKSYREINQERIKARKQEKITCSVCGSCFRKCDKARHERSQKHLAALENNK